MTVSDYVPGAGSPSLLPLSLPDRRPDIVLPALRCCSGVSLTRLLCRDGDRPRCCRANEALKLVSRHRRKPMERTRARPKILQRISQANYRSDVQLRHAASLDGSP